MKHKLEMNEDQYEHLKTMLNEAQSICNPIDFQSRQVSLLWCVAGLILRSFEKDVGNP